MMKRWISNAIKLAVALGLLGAFSTFAFAAQELTIRAEMVRTGVVVKWNYLPEHEGKYVYCAVYDENGRMLGTVVERMGQYLLSRTVMCDPAEADEIKVFLLEEDLSPVKEILMPEPLAILPIDFDARFHAVVKKVRYNESGDGVVEILREDGALVEVLHEKTLTSQKMSELYRGDLYRVGDADGDGKYEFYRAEFSDWDGDGKINGYDACSAALFWDVLFNGWELADDAIIFCCGDQDEWTVVTAAQFETSRLGDIEYGYGNRTQAGKYALRLAVSS